MQIVNKSEEKCILRMSSNQLSHLLRHALECNERNAQRAHTHAKFQIRGFRERVHQKWIEMKAKEKSARKWLCKVEFSI